MDIQIHQICDMIWKQRNESTQGMREGQPFERLLAVRGVKDWASFSAPMRHAEHDPFLMKDMDIAVELLHQHLQANSEILVFGDYDVDGTTSVAMMYEWLRQLGANVQFYIPNRYEEGYGFSITGAQHAVDQKKNLVITLDCGTKDGERIQLCRDHGIDVIVCDHHEPGELPNANALLNPKRRDCDYPFSGLSGCGVGYKLICAYTLRFPHPASFPDTFLDLVAIAAAADIVPMLDENRTLVAKGLHLMNRYLRPGLAALLRKSGTKRTTWEVTDLVFLLAPRINAAGRVASGNEAVKLLIAQEVQEVEDLAQQVEDFNMSRRSIDQDVSVAALSKVENDPKHADAFVTVVWDEDWLKGVIGIVASRLIERYYRPTIVFTKSHDVYAGSCRSIEGVDLYAALERCKEHIVQFGGHTMAAGLTVLPEKLEVFAAAFDTVVTEMLNHQRPEPTSYYDMALPLSEVEMGWVEEMKKMAPFGPDNMAPVFLFENVEHAFPPKKIGGDQKHVKCTLKQQGTYTYFDAVGFGLAKEWEVISSPRLDILAALEINEFNGRRTVQLMIKAVRAHVA
jgi:single-stranded-DNA-specific exonuclease